MGGATRGNRDQKLMKLNKNDGGHVTPPRKYHIH